MTTLASRTIVKTILIGACLLALEGCGRRTDPAETNAQSTRENSQSAQREDMDLQNVDFEILYEKEAEFDLHGNKLMMVVVLLREDLSEEALLSFINQVSENYGAYDNRLIDVVTSRAAYDEWVKLLSPGPDGDRARIERDRVLECTRLYPTLDDTLYSAMLQRSGAPRSDLCEYLTWGKKAMDGHKEGVVTTLDGRTVLYDPNEWNVKSDALGCAIQWSSNVDTPGRIGIRGKAMNRFVVAVVPKLRVSVEDANGQTVNEAEFELPRFKGMKAFETCVLAYSFPWDLRDGQRVRLNIVEPFVSEPQSEPQPDPNLPQTKVESTPVFYRTADAVKDAIQKDSGFSYTQFKAPKVGIEVKQLDRNPKYKTIETWEVQLMIRIDRYPFSPGKRDSIAYQMEVHVEHPGPQTYLRQEDGIVLGKDQVFVYHSEPSSHVDYATSIKSEWGWIEFPYELLKAATDNGLPVRIGGDQESARTLTIPKYYIDGFVKFADEKVVPYASSNGAPN